MTRHVTLPARGHVFINTDVHGNAEDFERMREIFEAAIARDTETYWVILGDIVHAPNDRARNRRPELYDYEDGSWEIADSVLEMRDKYPGHVHFVLGNHDYGHIGGPHTGKFYSDEVEFLEEKLDEEQADRLHELFEAALLCVLAPCGAFLSHGSPDVRLESLEELDDIELPPRTDRHREIIDAFVLPYGQPGEVCSSFLQRISELSGLDMTMLIHGHDRDEEGFFVEGGNQLVPVIFGAPRENRRYVRLDLSTTYTGIGQLKEGSEILRLYGDE